MRNRMKTEYIAIAFGLLGCTGHQPTYEYIFEAEPVDLQVKQDVYKRQSVDGD